MNSKRTDAAYEVTWLIRRLFRSMAAAADTYLDASGLTAAERAVMEFLYPDRRLTVPEIAARYDVSRQHVQVTVNGLVDKGLVRAEPNPRHKRSALLRLGSLGRDAFTEIRRNENEIIARAFAGIPDADVETTRDTLRRLQSNLNH